MRIKQKNDKKRSQSAIKIYTPFIDSSKIQIPSKLALPFHKNRSLTTKNQIDSLIEFTNPSQNISRFIKHKQPQKQNTQKSKSTYIQPQNVYITKSKEVLKPLNSKPKASSYNLNFLNKTKLKKPDLTSLFTKNKFNTNQLRNNHHRINQKSTILLSKNNYYEGYTSINQFELMSEMGSVIKPITQQIKSGDNNDLPFYNLISFNSSQSSATSLNSILIRQIQSSKTNDFELSQAGNSKNNINQQLIDLQLQQNPKQNYEVNKESQIVFKLSDKQSQLFWQIEGRKKFGNNNRLIKSTKKGYKSGKFMDYFKQNHIICVLDSYFHNLSAGNLLQKQQQTVSSLKQKVYFQINQFTFTKTRHHLTILKFKATIILPGNANFNCIYGEIQMKSGHRNKLSSNFKSKTKQNQSRTLSQKIYFAYQYQYHQDFQFNLIKYLTQFYYVKKSSIGYKLQQKSQNNSFSNFLFRTIVRIQNKHYFIQVTLLRNDIEKLQRSVYNLDNEQQLRKLTFLAKIVHETNCDYQNINNSYFQFSLCLKKSLHFTRSMKIYLTTIIQQVIKKETLCFRFRNDDEILFNKSDQFNLFNYARINQSNYRIKTIDYGQASKAFIVPSYVLYQPKDFDFDFEQLSISIQNSLKKKKRRTATKKCSLQKKQNLQFIDKQQIKKIQPSQMDEISKRNLSIFTQSKDKATSRIHQLSIQKQQIQPNSLAVNKFNRKINRNMSYSQRKSEQKIDLWRSKMKSQHSLHNIDLIEKKYNLNDQNYFKFLGCFDCGKFKNKKTILKTTAFSIYIIQFPEPQLNDILKVTGRQNGKLLKLNIQSHEQLLRERIAVLNVTDVEIPQKVINWENKFLQNLSVNRVKQFSSFPRQQNKFIRNKRLYIFDSIYTFLSLREQANRQLENKSHHLKIAIIDQITGKLNYYFLHKNIIQIYLNSTTKILSQKQATLSIIQKITENLSYKKNIPFSKYVLNNTPKKLSMKTGEQKQFEIIKFKKVVKIQNGLFLVCYIVQYLGFNLSYFKFYASWLSCIYSINITEIQKHPELFDKKTSYISGSGKSKKCIYVKQFEFFVDYLQDYFFKQLITLKKMESHQKNVRKYRFLLPIKYTTKMSQPDDEEQQQNNFARSGGFTNNDPQGIHQNNGLNQGFPNIFLQNRISSRPSRILAGLSLKKCSKVKGRNYMTDSHKKQKIEQKLFKKQLVVEKQFILKTYKSSSTQKTRNFLIIASKPITKYNQQTTNNKKQNVKQRKNNNTSKQQNCIYITIYESNKIRKFTWYWNWNAPENKSIYSQLITNSKDNMQNTIDLTRALIAKIVNIIKISNVFIPYLRVQCQSNNYLCYRLCNFFNKNIQKDGERVFQQQQLGIVTKNMNKKYRTFTKQVKPGIFFCAIKQTDKNKKKQIKFEMLHTHYQMKESPCNNKNKQINKIKVDDLARGFSNNLPSYEYNTRVFKRVSRIFKGLNYL